MTTFAVLQISSMSCFCKEQLLGFCSIEGFHYRNNFDYTVLFQFPVVFCKGEEVTFKLCVNSYV